MSEQPERPQLAQPPHGAGAPQDSSRVQYGPAVVDSTVAYASSTAGTRWVPLLSKRLLGLAMALGVVVGIGGPVLLWFTFKVGENRPFEARLGFLFVLIGLGVVLVALPLVLAEAARLERGPAGADLAGAGAPTGADSAGRASALVRGLTAPRVVALVGVLIIFAGAYLVRPTEATTADTGISTGNGNGNGGGTGQGSGRGNEGRGGGRGGGNGGGGGSGNGGGGGGTETPPTTTPPG